MTDEPKPNGNGKPKIHKGLVGGVAGIVLSLTFVLWVFDRIISRDVAIELRLTAEIEAVEERLTRAIEAEGDNIRARLNAYVEAGILRNPHSDQNEDC